MFQTAGVQLSEAALGLLMDRTEGWVAGLRLAALSLAGDRDPQQFAVEFSGSERTVSEYLLAEVLDRQPAEVRRLLLRTSVLERVNGELADLLTGGTGGERVLQDLAEANAFVLPVDTARTWFRYHQLFTGLLQLELRRSEPEEAAGLHELAATWFAQHRSPVEAVRHAQAAEAWGLASLLLSYHWLGLYLDGQAATAHALLAASSPRGLARPMPSWPRWRPPTRWRRVRSRWRNGTCCWPSTVRPQCRPPPARPGAGAARGRAAAAGLVRR